MSSVVLFFTLMLLMSLLAATVVVMPWLRPSKTVRDNKLLAVNVATFKQRLAELQADKEAGEIDKEHYEQQKLELQRQLLQAEQAEQPARPVRLANRLFVLMWVPLLTFLAYFILADRSPVMQLWQAEDHVGKVADDLLTGKIDVPPAWATEDSIGLISAMQTNVYRHAYDADRWMRLSELFLSLEATDSALQAMARAYRLQPDNDDIAMTYAQVSFFANGSMLTTDARRIVENLLKKDGSHEGAMMLMIMSETREGNYPQALDWINQLSASIGNKSGDHSKALDSLQRLKDDIQQKQQQASQALNVTVTVNTSLLPLIKPTNSLFVSVQEVTGGPPYAAKKLPASSINNGTIDVELSDTDAMMPSRRLSMGRGNNTKLSVKARISASGNATSQSGDLTSNPVVLNKDSQSVSIEINQQVP